MGSLIGHVLPGIAFIALGLWHLFNSIKAHALQTHSYTSWYPVSKIRYLELILIIIASSISVSFELFIGPERHQPLDPDGTIPSNHLHNLEHSLISATFIVYSTFAILFDKLGPKPPTTPSSSWSCTCSELPRRGFRSSTIGGDLTLLLGALAFGQEFFLFRMHSTDHKGVEGQYHLLLQIIIAVSLATTLMGIGFRKSFLASFVRSTSVLFQGIWLTAMGCILWTPAFLPKGCFLNWEDSHQVPRCSSDEALHRAKSLANILFSFLVIGIAIFGMSLYMALVGFGRQNVDRCNYSSLMAKDQLEEFKDVESEKNINVHGLQNWKANKTPPFDVEV